MKLKNYLALVLCIVLLVPVAISVMPQPTVMGGAGNGIDEKVTTLKQTADVVEFVAERLSQMGSGQQPYSIVNSDEIPVYTSATWYDETAYTMVHSYRTEIDAPGGEDDQRSDGRTWERLERRMTVYLTETASYYISEGTLSVWQDNYSEGETYSVDFKMHLYISAERKLLKYEKLDVASSSTGATADDFRKLKTFEDVWIDFTEDRFVVQEAIEVSQSNNRVLSVMGDYFRESKENFDKSGEIYTLQAQHLDSFMNAYLDQRETLEHYEGGFTVDLSNTTRPAFTLDLDVNDFYEWERSLGGYKYSSSGHVDQQGYEIFAFANINNTVISIPDDIKTIPVQEVNDMFEENDNEY